MTNDYGIPKITAGYPFRRYRLYRSSTVEFDMELQGSQTYRPGSILRLHSRHCGMFGSPHSSCSTGCSSLFESDWTGDFGGSSGTGAGGFGGPSAECSPCSTAESSGDDGSASPLLGGRGFVGSRRGNILRKRLSRSAILASCASNFSLIKSSRSSNFFWARPNLV